MNIPFRPLPVSRPDLSGNEEAYVVDAIRSSWISGNGKYVDRFEDMFARLCGVKHALSVSNGTTALQLALAGLGLKPGDEVLVPSLTYIATANAVRYMGAEPLFADVDGATWCLDPAGLEEKITERTRGIIAVHLYGHPADMDAINLVARRHGLWVVEDAAQAHGATYKGRPAGGLATAATYSFHGNKIFACGEGGAVTLNDAGLAGIMRQLRGQGSDPERRYHFPVLGYNFRLTNIACALLCAQLERADAIMARRRQIFEAYRRQLSGIAGIGFQPVAAWAEAAPWLFSITVDSAGYGHDRDGLAAILERDQIETRPFFPPVHEQPVYAQAGHAELPVTRRLAAEGLNLPTYDELAEADVERIAGTIRAAAR